MKRALLLAIAIHSTLTAAPLDQVKNLLNEQKQVEAFQLFLKELEHPNGSDGQAVVDSTYDDALKIYLNPHNSAAESAQEILEKYGNTEEPLTSYLIAVSHANKGHFEEFFTHFWRAYQVAPDHFLAHKAQAVLHIKLMERAATPEAKVQEKERVFHFVKNAFDREPKDHTLHRLLLTFCSDDRRKELVRASLNKIVNHNIITPRTDIKFYVQQAVAVQEYDLAQSLIDKTREWYQYSRAIDAAQSILDRGKKA